MIFTNPLVYLWQVIHASQLLSHFFPKYFKLAKIVTVHVLDSIDDDCCFTLAFALKNKLHNCLNLHLHLVDLYIKKFFPFENFPYQVTYGMCSNVNVTHGQGWYVWFKKVEFSLWLVLMIWLLRGGRWEVLESYHVANEKFSIMKLSPKFQELYNIHS